MAVGATVGYITGAHDKYGRTAPVWVLFFVIGAALLFDSVVVYAFLSAWNEKNEVSAGRVVYVDPLKRRTEVPLLSIKEDSMGSSPMRSGTKYWVDTPQGRISWSSGISNATDLWEIMTEASSTSQVHYQ